MTQHPLDSDINKFDPFASGTHASYFGVVLLAATCGLLLSLSVSLVQAQETASPLNTQEESIPRSDPQSSAEMFELPDGFEISVFAAEPDLTQPIAATFDDRGRLWVVENLTYSDSATNYDLTLHDRVVIFEDSDRDGQFDLRTVFWDQGQKVTGIEVGMGGIWLTAAPNLIFIPDADGDDVADGEPEIMLTGFEGDVIRHNIVNGLRWGPDGWLYGRHGIQATSFVGLPGSTIRTALNCSVWRFHPVKHKFEIVAEGGTNPWGLDFDQHGEMFISNTVIGHLFHIVPGARYRRMYGAHFNPHTYQVIEQTADHFHWDVGSGEQHSDTKPDQLSLGTDAAGGGHAHCGLLIYQGGNWPQKYHNTLLTANFHGRRINNDTLERVGNGYVARHGADLLKTSDSWFRGVELLSGPDGGVYLLDWSDIGECHENDGIHRTSGRIYKITHGSAAELPGLNGALRDRTDSELVELLSEPNEWYSRQARQLLQERSMKSSLTDPLSLKAKLFGLAANHSTEPGSELIRLRAMWTAYSCSMSDDSLSDDSLSDDSLSDDSFLISLTMDPNEHVRSWAVRLLADGLCEISPGAYERFCELAATDSSGLVRLYLASAIARCDAEQKLELAGILCAHAEDADDRTQPHLIWYNIEPVVIGNPVAAIQLAQMSSIPLIRENVVRRMAGHTSHGMDTIVEVNRELVADWLKSEDNPDKVFDALTGMALAFEGWSHAEIPSAWPDVVAKLDKSDDARIKPLLQSINLVFGVGRSIADLKSLIGDNTATPEARRSAIATWAKTSPFELFDTLRPLANDKALTGAVVRAFVYCDNENVPDVIFARFPHMDPDDQTAAITTLTSRKPWAGKLLDQIASGAIPKDRVSALHAGYIVSLDDEQLDARLVKVWGHVRSSPEEKRKAINRIAVEHFSSDSFTPPPLENADASRGRQLFKEKCAICHTLYGVGGTTGPDLTGGDRYNLNYLLISIVDPGSFVAENYRASVLLMEDGRTITGLVLDSTDRIVRVQTPTEIISLEKDSIEAMRLTELSVMPEGILENMTTEEVGNLFKYLFSQQQVPLPPTGN